MYDSVEGTEGALQWTRESVLRGAGFDGRNFGRQLVTFETWQAYPQLLVTIRLRQEQEPEPEIELEPEPEPEPEPDSLLEPEPELE